MRARLFCGENHLHRFNPFPRRPIGQRRTLRNTALPKLNFRLLWNATGRSQIAESFARKENIGPCCTSEKLSDSNTSRVLT